MVTLFSITLGLLIAGILLAVGYARLVREPERLRWIGQAQMHADNAAYFKRFAMKNLDRWHMLQGYPPNDEFVEGIDRNQEPAEDDEPARLLSLPDDELAERLREMNDPRSGMSLDERRRLSREHKRRLRTGRTVVQEPEEEQTEGFTNELDMGQQMHLRG